MQACRSACYLLMAFEDNINLHTVYIYIYIWYHKQKPMYKIMAAHTILHSHRQCFDFCAEWIFDFQHCQGSVIQYMDRTITMCTYGRHIAQDVQNYRCVYDDYAVVREAASRSTYNLPKWDCWQIQTRLLILCVSSRTQCWCKWLDYRWQHNKRPRDQWETRFQKHLDVCLKRHTVEKMGGGVGRWWCWCLHHLTLNWKRSGNIWGWWINRSHFLSNCSNILIDLFHHLPLKSTNLCDTYLKE